MKPLRVLELGNYVVPSYAGMILAEQGHRVTKWVKPGSDPILSLNRGDELWAWLQQGKTLCDTHPKELLSGKHSFDIILDNFRPSTLANWGIDPVQLARERGWVWVSMRSEVGERSFDIVAQARSWMEYAPWVPFWAGDTIGGLWLAFKALAVRGQPGHYLLGQASVMQKLVEGELLIDVVRRAGEIPWETETYRFEDGIAKVDYRGEVIREPVRDRAWKLANLWHREGCIKI